MIILDATDQKIEFLLGGAVTTNELSWMTSYVDHTDETFVPASSNGVSSGATPVTLMAAPAASTQRQLKYVNIYNADTVAAVVTVQLDDNTVDRVLLKVTLQPGYQLTYVDSDGWKVLDDEGKVLILQALSGDAIPKSIMDAKGDLITASADNTPIKLTAASKKYSKLYADSGQSGGLAWGLRRYVQVEPFSFANNKACASGDGKAEIHIPAHLDGLDLVECHAEVKTAGTTGTMAIQVRNVTQAADMLITKLTIDSGETGSDEATAYVIDTNNDDVAENDMLAIDFDTLHTTPAIGCIVTLGFA